MGIQLNWDSQTDQNLDAIEIYRSDKPIDENNPGSPIATLAGDAVGYNDTNVRVGNTYYYVIAVVKGGNRSFTANQTQGYYSNLGPGGQVITRGDWVRGYFGEMTTTEWVTVLDVTNKIKDQLKSLTGITLRTDTNNLWYKFVYKGKILFIPSVQMITSTNWQNGYNAGFIYGTDDFGKTPDGDAGNVNQRVVIELGGYQFIARAIRLSDKPTTQYLTDPLDFNDSEWKGTYARLRADAAALTDATIQTRIGDLGSVVGTGSAHMADTTNLATVSNSAPETLTKAVKTASINWMVVLELLP
ncbi:putative virion structural protein [Erwinia phage Derbicus]|uniref:Putative virion structural protein n=2 Tax=Derbicusvirus derbicus TaxID=2734104 RepID=A0A482IHZ3_9CAUD|nr:putative virion structural protein [Erwinia phage vB_EamM_EarlPhillipIV]YP_009821194.1 putative virion structural protein [Erwinia phage Derbicus]ANZ48999.1 putative virion structural protein [Erwinia phage vB_EamM_EarlPhillipIV]QBP07576.1 putative virion structural protein [Erwinia phage Derbicus]